MKERIESLLGLLRKWHQDPAAMEVAPSVESAHLPWPLPPPPVSWTLIGLMRYRSRARFAVKAVSDHLLRDVAEKEMRAACLRTLAESRACGCLPGLPEWTYELDPRESLLKHQQTSECISFRVGRFTYFASDSLGKYNIFIECQRVLGSAPWDDKRWKEAGNFLLRPDAEAFKRLPGFKPIPFDKIGPEPRTASISR